MLELYLRDITYSVVVGKSNKTEDVLRNWKTDTIADVKDMCDLSVLVKASKDADVLLLYGRYFLLFIFQ